MDRDRSRGFEGCWQGVDISGAGLTALLLCLLGVILFSISMGTNKWIVADNVDMGLFQYCSDRCDRYFDNRFPPTGQTSLNLVTRTEAAAAFLGLAIVIIFFSIVFTIFGLGRPGFDKVMWRASNFCAISACCGLVATVIMGVLESEMPSSFKIGASFSTNIAAWVCSLLAAGLLSIDSHSITYIDASKAVRQGGRQMI
eukprot:m.8876 g.8876  ORF g.8876 m.8876 type:complete len:199 (-) comp3289_c0_seq1:276-872(-)